MAAGVPAKLLRLAGGEDHGTDERLLRRDDHAEEAAERVTDEREPLAVDRGMLEEKPEAEAGLADRESPALLRGVLYGVSPADPLTFTGIPVLLAGVALLASYLPARRATRIEATEALRSEG